MNELFELAKLVNDRNYIDQKIASIIGRPGNIGHVGEFIAAKIFNITLMEAANTRGIDGYFIEQLNSKSVNIKWYTKDQRMLDINPVGLPDYYLVLAGIPDSTLGSSKGKVSPWTIQKVYLFNSKDLMRNLINRKVKVGIATSITKSVWEVAEIYPDNLNHEYILTDQQKKLLSLFSGVENVI